MSGGVQLTGEPVTVSGVGDLAAGHGRFCLEQPGPARARAAVESLWLEIGTQSRQLEPATVFDVDRDEGLDPRGFDVDPGTMTFLLGFPPVVDETGPAESMSVGLRLDVDGSTVEALSPIVFERRRPG